MTKPVFRHLPDDYLAHSFVAFMDTPCRDCLRTVEADQSNCLNCFLKTYAEFRKLEEVKQKQ